MSKICFQCRSEVDDLASTCPHCLAKLGPAKSGQVAGRKTHGCVMAIAVLFGFCIVVGVIGAVVSGDKAKSSTQPIAEPVDTKFGPKPDTSVMAYALQTQLKQSLHDPSSLEGPDLREPFKDTIQVKGKPVGCWRVDLSYRAKNGLGALRLSRGTIWMKDGASIKEVMH